MIEICQDTDKWAKRLKLHHETDTLLCMAHRESALDPTTDDVLIVGPKRHSVGIYQTRVDYMPWLRQLWLERGYKLGPDDDIDTMCAYGVMEFYFHLKHWDGNVWLGVRHYNGSGPKAREYARRVFVSRRVIFHRPHFEGEHFLPKE